MSLCLQRTENCNQSTILGPGLFIHSTLIYWAYTWLKNQEENYLYWTRYIENKLQSAYSTIQSKYNALVFFFSPKEDGYVET